MTESVLRRLYHRTMMMVGRGRITTVDDSQGVQYVQIDMGPKGQGGSLQLRDKTPVHQYFGFASNPPIGADAIVLSLGGDHNKSVILGHNHQSHRLKNLAAGDAALYDVRGAYAWFTSTGLVIDAAGGNVTVQNAKNVSVTASGNVAVTATSGNVSINTTNVTVTASGTATVSAATVNLGGTGGAAVARVGDSVVGGVITTGSSKVKAT